MKNFYGDNLLLDGSAATELYEEVKHLPIIDYHCHLDQRLIAGDAELTDIGELWLSGDHYKWKAMRVCGVDEYYITGGAGWKEKFVKFAEIMPKLIGNPLYYWSQLELKQVFGINEPLCGSSAESIYARANESLKGMTVRGLLGKFGVQYIATTDSPSDDLSAHGDYDGISVRPTFRPDSVLMLDRTAIADLGESAGVDIQSFADIKTALCRRLDFFAARGCKIADHGFLDFPDVYASDISADKLYQNAEILTDSEKNSLFGNLLLFLLREYKKRGMTVQLHLSVKRNINAEMYERVGRDSGFDVISRECDLDGAIKLLGSLRGEDRPTIILYSLNPNAVVPLTCISGAFRNVYMGAAWWFNDTVSGIRQNLNALAEYSALGVHLGMLTDSRSFLSYSRFDFFRRLLCSFVGVKVDGGECSMEAAKNLVKDICYNNIKCLLGI